MITTYIVEDLKGIEVIEYFRRLSDAKYYVEANKLKARILCIKGPEFGEGFHKYRLTLVDSKWVKEKLS